MLQPGKALHRLFSVIITSFFLTGMLSCSQPHNDVQDINSDWEYIELSEQMGIVYDVCGSLENDLIASTQNGIYKSVDGGKTWTKKAQTFNPVISLEEKDGVIYGLYPDDVSSYYYVFISSDKGETWDTDMQSAYTLTTHDPAKDAKGNFLMHVHSESLPCEIKISANGGNEWTAIFGNAYVHRMHVDDQNIFYLASSSLIFNKNATKWECATPNELPRIYFRQF